MDHNSLFGWPVHPGWFAAIAVVLWATSALPEYLIALLFFAGLMVFSAAPANITFAGFLSAAFWLVLSGFVLGSAIKKVGLADRIANAMASRLSGSWFKLVSGVICLTYILAFVMPSNMGRVTLLMPIIMALADRAGLTVGTNGRTGLALAVGLGTYELSASILPANVPNLVMTGAIEKSYGLHLAYLPYLVLHTPVLGILRAILIALSIVWLFPARIEKISGIEPAGPLSRAERRLSILLLITLAFWITDSLHGIQPAWVGLVSACICLLPRIGFLTSDEFAEDANFRTCIYVAGILGLAAVVAWSGLGDKIGNKIIPWLPISPDKPGLSFASIIGLGSMLSFVVTSNGLPAIFTPLAHSLSDASGLPLMGVLMSQVIGYSTPWLPYQAAPLVVAISLGNVPRRAAIKACLFTGAVTFAILMPLDYFWFRILGWI